MDNKCDKCVVLTNVIWYYLGIMYDKDRVLSLLHWR